MIMRPIVSTQTAWTCFGWSATMSARRWSVMRPRATASNASGEEEGLDLLPSEPRVEEGLKDPLAALRAS